MLAKASELLIGNFSFTLFLFFLYKYMTSIAITLKFGMTSLAMIDMILMAMTLIILISYIVLLAYKIEFFSSFTGKISKRDENNYKAITNTRKQSILK